MASHDEVVLQPVPHRGVASWPEGTFVENLIVLPEGDLVVSLHSDRNLVRVARDGSRVTLARTPGPPTGLVVDSGRLFFTGGEIGTAPHAVYAVEVGSGPDGDHGDSCGGVRQLVDVPGAVFLNGFTPGRRDSVTPSTNSSARYTRSTSTGPPREKYCDTNC